MLPDNAAARLSAKREEIATEAAAAVQAVYTAAYQQIGAAAAKMATDVARAGTTAIDNKSTATRESLRELANLQGVLFDDEFIRGYAAASVRAGMTPHSAKKEVS